MRLVMTTCCLLSEFCLNFATPTRALSDSKRCDWYPSCSTPGVSLGLKEIAREKVSGSTRVDYALVPGQFPREHAYNLWMLESGSTVPLLFVSGLYADSVGALQGDRARLEFVPGNPKPIGFDLAGFDFSISAYSRGEAVRWAVVSEDSTVAAYALFYPFPIEGRQGSMYVWAERGRPDGCSFVLCGEGFEPGETAHLTARLKDEAIEDTLRIWDDGSFPPYNLESSGWGKKSGKVSVTVTGKGGTVPLEFEWGKGARKAQ